jgi:hypothetical protein
MLTLLVQQCFNMGLVFAPRLVLTDFEISAISSVQYVWPETELMCCRFHLGQSWFRQIQQLGLVQSYKDKNCDEGKWLTRFFGLSLLSAADVQDAFATDIMDDAPTSESCMKFADYVLNNYISDGAIFAPQLWAAVSNQSVRTTNAAESFHSHLNAQFYTSRPNIYLFVDVLLRVQTGTYITINSCKTMRVNKRESEKIAKFMSLYTQLQCGEISRKTYLQTLSYQFAP